MDYLEILVQWDLTDHQANRGREDYKVCQESRVVRVHGAYLAQLVFQGCRVIRVLLESKESLENLVTLVSLVPQDQLDQQELQDHRVQLVLQV